jgi:hypothetical protein
MAEIMSWPIAELDPFHLSVKLQVTWIVFAIGAKALLDGKLGREAERERVLAPSALLPVSGFLRGKQSVHAIINVSLDLLLWNPPALIGKRISLRFGRTPPARFPEEPRRHCSPQR